MLENFRPALEKFVESRLGVSTWRRDIEHKSQVKTFTDHLLKEYVVATAAALGRRQDTPTIKQVEEFKPEIVKIKSSFNTDFIKSIGIIDEFKDFRKQEARADTVARMKALVFRVVTTAAIAGVVLLTGYIAQKYSIPLPMLKTTGP